METEISQSLLFSFCFSDVFRPRMFDEEKRFYQDERSKFQTLLNSLGWSEEGLLKEVGFLFYVRRRTHQQRMHFF